MSTTPLTKDDVATIIEALSEVPDDVFPDDELEVLIETIGRHGVTDELRAKALTVLESAVQNEQSRRAQLSEARAALLAAPSVSATAEELQFVREVGDRQSAVQRDLENSLVTKLDRPLQEQQEAIDATEAESLRQGLMRKPSDN